jgi:hypothetical protein
MFSADLRTTEPGSLTIAALRGEPDVADTASVDQ